MRLCCKREQAQNACLVFVGSLNREARYFQGARRRAWCLQFRRGDAGDEELAETGDVDNPTFLSVTLVDHTPCGGATPRNLALTPSGRHLLSANQNADRINIFARDAATGRLADTGRSIDIGTPMCVKIVR